MIMTFSPGCVPNARVSVELRGRPLVPAGRGRLGANIERIDMMESNVRVGVKFRVVKYYGCSQEMKYEKRSHYFSPITDVLVPRSPSSVLTVRGDTGATKRIDYVLQS